MEMDNISEFERFFRHKAGESNQLRKNKNKTDRPQKIMTDKKATLIGNVRYFFAIVALEYLQ